MLKFLAQMYIKLVIPIPLNMDVMGNDNENIKLLNRACLPLRSRCFVRVLWERPITGRE